MWSLPVCVCSMCLECKTSCPLSFFFCAKDFFLQSREPSTFNRLVLVQQQSYYYIVYVRQTRPDNIYQVAALN